MCSGNWCSASFCHLAVCGEISNGALTPLSIRAAREIENDLGGILPQKGQWCNVTALLGYFFWPYCFLMPPVILLQRAELWELRAELRANRPWRVWRFRHGQVYWYVERHAKTPRYNSLHVGRRVWGDERHAVSHAEGDLKDKETMKCEHGRDVFEVTPTSPAHTTTATATTTSAQPLPVPYQPPFPFPYPSPPPSFPLSHLAGSYTLSWPGGCGEFSSGSC